MLLPRCEDVVVPQEKVADYLLSATHRDGRHTAAFFARFGFRVEAWQVLAEALKRHARDHEVVSTESSPFGTRFVVEGRLHSPDGRNPRLRSVWFLQEGEAIPRLATAYPLPGE